MPANENFYSLFAQHVAADAAAPCLVTASGDRLCRRWLDETSAQYANGLVSIGLAPGDRVAVQAEKSPEFLSFYLGCLRAGLSFTPLNTAYTNEEMRYLLADCAPSLVVSQIQASDIIPPETKSLALTPDGRGSLRDLREGRQVQFETLAVDGEAIAAILYTSGTTGRPKGATMSHRSLQTAASGLVREWEFTASDILLHALPLFHGHGLFISSNVALAAGASLIFLDRFDPDVITANLPAATVFMGVPTYYHRLLASPNFTADACRNIRLITCGSAPLPIEILRDVEHRVGHRIVERYGATEAMIICSNPIKGERRSGTVGRALDEVQLRIAGVDDTPLPDGEIGEIQIRGPALFSGYWGRPDATEAEFTKDGFFRTGDLGSRSTDGYVTVTGRSKDLIISGGYNVYPAEIEAALGELTCVADSAIVGRPDLDFGEVVVAFVVPTSPASHPTSDELRTWAKGRLANYKVPKEFHFVDELPRNVMGKVLKAELRNRLSSASTISSHLIPARETRARSAHSARRKNMGTELFEKGLKIRKEVLGTEYVEAALKSADDFTRDLQELLTAFSWGEIWSRPGLDRKTRSMLNIAIAAASNRSGELKLHVRGAINNGVTKDEIKEVLLQCTVYCGAPAGADGFRLAKEAFAELSV